MFKPNHILVPIAVAPSDDVTLARTLIDDAVSLLPPNGRLTLLYVEPISAVYFGIDTGFAPPSFYSTIADIREKNRMGAVDALKKLKAEIAQRGGGFTIDTMTMEPVEGIGEAVVHCAKDIGADAIAVLSHSRRGLKRLFLGSVAERVAHLAEVPVFIFRTPPNP